MPNSPTPNCLLTHIESAGIMCLLLGNLLGELIVLSVSVDDALFNVCGFMANVCVREAEKSKVIRNCVCTSWKCQQRIDLNRRTDAITVVIKLKWGTFGVSVLNLHHVSPYNARQPNEAKEHWNETNDLLRLPPAFRLDFAKVAWFYSDNHVDSTFHRIFVIVVFPVSIDRLASSPHRWHTSNAVPMLFSIHSYI